MVKMITKRLGLAALLCVLGGTWGVVSASASQQRTWTAHRYDAALLKRLQQQADAPSKAQPTTMPVLIHLKEQSKGQGIGLSPYAKTQRGTQAKRHAWIDHLRQQATQQQTPLVAWLKAHGIEHQTFWVANAIQARVPMGLMESLATREDVALLQYDGAQRRLPNTAGTTDEREARVQPKSIQAVPWGLRTIQAPEVWALGIRGQGAVIGGQDTGDQWDHPALINSYRGWDGSTADHNHHWHDAIQTSIAAQANPCGINLQAPCDDHGHGTHTIGTISGMTSADDIIGAAPEAKWIGCRNMDQGVGRPSTYIACFQWFMAPTDLAGNNPRPDLAPDVINNSWSCPPSELCDATATQTMRQVVQNVRTAGIVIVVSAGNSGNACQTVTTPAAIFPESFTIGASDSNDAIAKFSSRGTTPNGVLKPNVSAPGVGVHSAWLGGGYRVLSGTSMAAPHVTGTIALMISANPALRGQPEQIEAILEATAKPLTTEQSCGGYAASDLPNAVFGYGRIDALAAVKAAQAVLFVDGFE